MPSSEQLTRVPSSEQLTRVPSSEQLTSVPSSEQLTRVPSSDISYHREISRDQLSQPAVSHNLIKGGLCVLYRYKFFAFRSY